MDSPWSGEFQVSLSISITLFSTKKRLNNLQRTRWLEHFTFSPTYYFYRGYDQSTDVSTSLTFKLLKLRWWGQKGCLAFISSWWSKELGSACWPLVVLWKDSMGRETVDPSREKRKNPGLHMNRVSYPTWQLYLCLIIWRNSWCRPHQISSSPRQLQDHAGTLKELHFLL